MHDKLEDTVQMRPHLRRLGNVSQLYVDGRAVIVRGGEVHNSSSTSRKWMAPIWDQTSRGNFNALLAVVPWDLFEPQEGIYDYTIIDDMIADARAHGMKLIPLWFGSWKNAATHYAPLWVKADTKRFPRIRSVGGNLEVLTPIGEETCKADTKAFAALMRHIGEVDGQDHTVIMVQVQNEPGVNGESRDRSEAAEQLFRGSVPSALLDYLRDNKAKLLPETLELWKGRRAEGSWQEVFGDDADEVFMAWHFACFIDRQAEAGKAEYDIPMFVNVWLSHPEHVGPGQGYPSGGAVNHVQDIWRAGAPSIDMLAPDVHTPEVHRVINQYNRAGNPLFIPESKNELEGASSAVYSIGQGAIGFSPFGIEKRNADLIDGPLARAYGLLASLEPLIIEHQAKGTITGARVSLDRPQDVFVFGGYRWIVSLLHYHKEPQTPKSDYGYCIIMQTGPDSFLIGGMGAQIRFAMPEPSNRVVALGSVDEGEFVGGSWVGGRRLSGDEIINSYKIQELLKDNQTGTEVKFWGKMPHCLKVTLYSYEK
jgi:hypothetical protein